MYHENTADIFKETPPPPKNNSPTHSQRETGPSTSVISPLQHHHHCPNKTSWYTTHPSELPKHTMHYRPNEQKQHEKSSSSRPHTLSHYPYPNFDRQEIPYRSSLQNRLNPPSPTIEKNVITSTISFPRISRDQGKRASFIGPKIGCVVGYAICVLIPLLSTQAAWSPTTAIFVMKFHRMAWRRYRSRRKTKRIVVLLFYVEIFCPVSLMRGSGPLGW